MRLIAYFVFIVLFVIVMWAAWGPIHAGDKWGISGRFSSGPAWTNYRQQGVEGRGRAYRHNVRRVTRGRMSSGSRGYQSATGHSVTTSRTRDTQVHEVQEPDSWDEAFRYLYGD